MNAAPTPSKFWTASSLAAAVLALPLGALTLIDPFRRLLGDCGTFELRCAFHAFLIANLAFTGGLIMAAIAMTQQERPPWLTWIAFVFNGIPVAASLFFMLAVANR